jgi:phosphate-selective porin OprO/OprP
LLDGELAYQCGRLRVQAEKIAVGVARNDPLPALNFGGGYVCASFFLTHDAYPYEWRAAQFQRVRPTGKIGAIEIAARYSYADLNDLEVKGGQAGAFTVGMYWYPNPNIKMMLDYVMLNNDANANAKGTLVGNDDYRFLQFRFQAAF